MLSLLFQIQNDRKFKVAFVFSKNIYKFGKMSTAFKKQKRGDCFRKKFFDRPTPIAIDESEMAITGDYRNR